MQAVLMSIHPKWCELIANGKKTIEVRKTKPKINVPFKVYIYCTVGGDALCPPHANCNSWTVHRQNNGTTNGRIMSLNERAKSDYCYANGKVIGEFVCDSISKCDIDGLKWWDMLEHVLRLSCLEMEELQKYVGNDEFYGWHISDLVIYDKPKELSEFYVNCDWVCGECKCDYFINHKCTTGFKNHKPLTRPPQSWCYVEEVSE